MKSQGKPGIVREFCIIFIQVRKSQGKLYLVRILFSLSLWMVVRKVAVQFVVSKWEFYHFA